ncbi:MAG: hypothetical protein LBM99_02625 [Bacillales bacterium]|jgi:uncharacterized membrane protein YdbT with pleckstrin-like domain|nr:hypothetical protein [Bacillales bacterium]
MSRKIQKSNTQRINNPIYWTSHSISRFVKGLGALVLLSVLILASFSFAIFGEGFVRWIVVALIALLALYVLYSYFAIFYVLEEKELKIFCRWKIYHFPYVEIRNVQPAQNLTRNLLGSGDNCLLCETSNLEFVITPSRFEEFSTLLQVKRNQARNK